MKNKLTITLAMFVSTLLFGQKTDTLTFYSEAFNQTRTVYIKTPRIYKYRSDSTQLPVIFILDGQHEWFVNPILTNIEYLQYTHAIPSAIVVVIPHTNRVAECGIRDISADLPLNRFITQELNENLKPYNPHDFKVIIGHSFSASFALYSHLTSSNYYSAVVANSPLDKLEALIEALEKNRAIDRSKIAISVGAKHKDSFHRNEFDRLKLKHASFFESINTFEADYASHNALPIIATPFILTKIFDDFSFRYRGIARVNEEYKLISSPKSVPEEVESVLFASKIGSYYYPPEIPDINGIASRYLYSNYDEHALKFYELGLTYYPKFYGFHFSLYELLLVKDKQRAKGHLNEAERLLENIEAHSIEKTKMLDKIKSEKLKNGW